MALTTRCPQCGTAFKVVADQLRVRNGLVRCGVCASVFDGRAHLDEDRRPSPAVESAPARVPDHHPEPAYTRPTAYTPEPRYTPPVRPAHTPPPAPAYTPPPVANRPPPAPVVPEVFRGREHALRRAQSEPSFEPEAERRDHDYDDDRWSMRSDAPTPQAPAAPVTYDDDLADVRPDLTQWGRRGAAAPDEFDERDEPEEPASYGTGFYAERHDGGPREPRLTEGGNPDAVVQGEPRTRYVDDYHSGRTPPTFLDDGDVERRSLRSTLWGTGCIILFVVLLGMLAYTYRTQIAASFPPLRPLMEAACRPLACTVGYERRIERISIMSSSLRPPQGSASATGDAQDLVLTVVLRNRFNAPQPWPALTLELNDLADTVVVRKVILPADYLPADIAAGPFGANAEHRVVLPIAVRDVQVNGYQLDKFFP